MGILLENKGALTGTIVVAASNSLNESAANYTCSGAADDVEINLALASGIGGEVVLLEGDYVTSQNIVVPANTKFRGMGKDTVITPTGAAITNGIVVNGDNVVIRDMKVILAAGAGAVNTRPNVIFADTRTLVWLENLWLVGDTSVADDASDLRQCGVMFVTVTESKIVSCRSEDNDRHAIHLNNASNYNTIGGNTAEGNSQWGILVYNNSHYNTVDGNTSSGNGHGGINIATSNNNTVAGNTCQGNTLHGVLVYTALNNTIAGNTCQGNSANGINVSDTSTNNTITGNTSQGNANNGIYVHDGSINNTITGNTSADNTWHGIFVSESNQNVITGNQVDDNGVGGTYHGIYIYRSSYCTVTGNVCVNNLVDGINVTGDATADSHYNTITANVCYNNANDGIEIAGGADAVKNIVLGNQLLGNGVNALLDNGVATDVGHNITV